MADFSQVLLLLGVSVAVVVAFQRLHIPTSLGYLLVGVILGPHTVGPIVNLTEYNALAEFGVVFLLFTIGLNYSLPQLNALRGQVLGLGTAQVALTTLLVFALLWMAGLPGAAAFVIGAVFAQSSSTIIGSQLAEQGEDNSHHGRLGLAISVFQDVTAVPFLVVIPVLGLAVGADTIAAELGWAVAKAVLAFGIVFFVGRWLLRPLFHLITTRRSPEVLTLAVLLVALLAAWCTSSLGLSLAFGAFLAGMMLGETEFRHQVESTIRPFRDVLLGLFFVGIGMLIDLGAVTQVWHWALLGASLLMGSKILIVGIMVRRTGIDIATAWRTGLLLAVGGEFGFALLAIALDASVLSERLGQIALASVLFSMILGALLIRFNGKVALWLAPPQAVDERDRSALPSLEASDQTVLIGGYGRVGYTVAALLQAQGIPYVAFDMDPARVAQGRLDGHTVMYGDISDPELLGTIHAERASLVIMTVDHSMSALRAVSIFSHSYPQVPVIARAWDLQSSHALIEAGAVQAYPETIESSLRLGETALKMLNVPAEDVDLIMQGVRDWDYRPVIESKAEHNAPLANS